MFFNIFCRSSEKERHEKKLEKGFRAIGKAYNPDLIARLEDKKDEGKVYFAIKEVFQDYISQRMPGLYEQAKQIMQSVGAAQSIKGLKDINKSDPLTTFLFLIQIHARLLTEEEFKNFLKDSLEFPPEFTEKVIFNNPNLKLKFRSG